MRRSARVSGFALLLVALGACDTRKGPSQKVEGAHDRTGSGILSKEEVLKIANASTVVVESVFDNRRTSGLGAVIRIDEDPQSETGRTAYVLTSRYLIDPFHPILSASNTGNLWSVNVRWLSEETSRHAKVEWMAPCEQDSNNYRYRLDHAIVTAPAPLGASAFSRGNPSSDGPTWMANRTTQGGLYLEEDHLKHTGYQKSAPAIGSGASSRRLDHYELDIHKYVFGSEETVCLGSPICDLEGRLIGIVDAVNIFEALEDLSIERYLADRYSDKSDAACNNLKTYIDAKFGELNYKLSAMREPAGFAFLIKKLAVALSGSEPGTATNSVAFGPEAVAIGLRIWANRKDDGAFSALARATKDPNIEAIIQNSNGWDTAANLAGSFTHLAEAAINIWREYEINKGFEQAELKSKEQIDQSNRQYNEKLSSLLAQITAAWSSLLQRKLRTRTCSVGIATSVEELTTRIYAKPGFGFSRPDGWTITNGSGPDEYFGATHNAVHGKLLLHPESKKGVHWDLIGLAATWLASKHFPVETFDASKRIPIDVHDNRSGYWHFKSPFSDQMENLVAIWERDGIGYVWEFKWKASPDAQKEILAFLENFRMEYRSEAKDAPPAARELLMTLAGEALSAQEFDFATNAYLALRVYDDPDDVTKSGITAKNLVRSLCAANDALQSRPEVAHHYANLLIRELPKEDHSLAAHTLDSLAHCRFDNGLVDDAIALEEKALLEAQVVEVLARARGTTLTFCCRTDFQRSLQEFRFRKSLGRRSAGVRITEHWYIGRVHEDHGGDTSRQFSLDLNIAPESSICILIDSTEGSPPFDLFFVSAVEYDKYRDGKNLQKEAKTFSYLPDLSRVGIKGVNLSGTVPGGQYRLIIDNSDWGTKPSKDLLNQIIPVRDDILRFRMKVIVAEPAQSTSRQIICSYLTMPGITIEAAEGAAVVAKLTKGSPADRLGIKPNDKIVGISVDSRSGNVASVKDFNEALRGTRSGQRIGLRYEREGKVTGVEYRCVPLDPFRLTPP